MLDEVLPGQRAVAVHARVGDVSVEHGPDLDPAVPAVCAEDGALCGETGVTDVDETGVGDAQAAAFGVVEEHAAGERSRLQVQRDATVAKGRMVRGEPVAGWCAVGQAAVTQGGPVRQPDHVLVGRLSPGDGGGEPVVAAGQVRARVVDVVGGALGG